jgi:hypothetical protein
MIIRTLTSAESKYITDALETLKRTSAVNSTSNWAAGVLLTMVDGLMYRKDED